MHSGERYIADSQDPESECAGGLSFEGCETAKLLFEASRDFRTPPNRRTGDGSYNTLVFAAVVCEACKYACSLSVEMMEGKPTENARLICDPPQ